MELTNIFDYIKSKTKSSCSAVIVAAGSSTRMGEDKIMMDLCGKPVILRTLLAFENAECVDEIIVVTNKEKLEVIAELVKKNNLTKVSKVILGGQTRTESCLSGVCAVNKKAKYIAIHDGARPFVTEKLIKSCLFAAMEFKAAAPGIKVNDTLKTTSSGIISGDINRDETVRIQTPQVFDSDLIKGALSFVISKKISVTDDCSAVELLGVRAKIVNGDPDNIKLTDKNDFFNAESIIKNRGTY